jgi:hypothetical protein
MPAFYARKGRLQQQFPSSLYTRFFMGCQLAAWGIEQNQIKNLVSYVLRGAPPNNMLHQLHSL